MKGKEGSGDPEGLETKSGLASSGGGLDTSGEKSFFADVANVRHHTRLHRIETANLTRGQYERV